MLRSRWARHNEKYWSRADQYIRGWGTYLAEYRGNHMKALVNGPLVAYGRVDSEVSYAFLLAAAGRDAEAVEWFHEALELFDTALAMHSHERVAGLSADNAYSLYRVLLATYYADWAVTGTNDIQWLGRARAFESQCLALDGLKEYSDPKRHDLFISALAEAEDRDAALASYGLLYPEHSSIEGMCALNTPGSMACALMLTEGETDNGIRASVNRAYEGFLAGAIRYDKNGPSWPFQPDDFIRFQYFRHKYIERDSPSVFELIREARGI